MTNGIIQQAIDAANNLLEDSIYDASEVSDILTKLEQELIEKIKQELPHLIDSEHNSHTQKKDTDEINR